MYGNKTRENFAGMKRFRQWQAPSRAYSHLSSRRVPAALHTVSVARFESMMYFKSVRFFSEILTGDAFHLLQTSVTATEPGLVICTIPSYPTIITRTAFNLCQIETRTLKNCSRHIIYKELFTLRLYFGSNSTLLSPPQVEPMCIQIHPLPNGAAASVIA